MKRSEKWKEMFKVAEIFAEDEDLYNDPIDAMTNFAIEQNKTLLDRIRKSVEGFEKHDIEKGEHWIDFIPKADMIALLDEIEEGK